jgi:hypothetical protein
MKFYQKGSEQKGGGYFSNSQAHVDRFNNKVRGWFGR